MARVMGRGSAGFAAMVAIVVGVLAMALGAYATTYEVGGATQMWNYPPSTNEEYYSSWSSNYTFKVGDKLEFKYTVNEHNVVEYATNSEYTNCAGTAVKTWTSGDDIIMLNKTGTYYFICSYPTHCSLGMKVSVNVTAAKAAPSPSPSTSSTPVGAPSTTTTSPSSSPTSNTPSSNSGPSPSSPGSSAASPSPAQSMAGLVAAGIITGFAILV